MHNCEYELHLEATESRLAQNEDNSYTFRVPFGLLKTPDSNLLKTVIETAGVAFGHNRPDSKNLVITCPVGHSEDINWLVTGLKQAGIQVQVKEQARSKFVDITALKGSTLCCVDRRLDDQGVHPLTQTGQITHAGGPLVLDPNLRQEMPANHVEVLQKGIQTLAEAGAPLKALDYHFGAEGGGGCGMYNLLTRLNQRIKDALSTPQDICEMLNRVRDELGRFAATDCMITGSVVYGDGSTMTYNLDEVEDKEALLAERNLVL